MAAPTQPASPDFLPKKRTNGSIIWRYFGFKPSDEEQKEAFCRECKKLVQTKGSSTTNLFNHLQHHHKLLCEECARLRFTVKTTTTTCKKSQQTTLQTSLSQSIPYEKTSARYKLPSYKLPSYKLPSYKLPRYKLPSYKLPSYKLP
ncbi:hypothetical protein ACEWY4_001867 [Coilia grayii]|uniref:BED-type domain-containing protein n=1 Tax=Coilia grayii TaxID=363190 RepID=A0ABD1KU53_9TELE